MFSLEQFIDRCQHQPPSIVKELLLLAMSDAEGLKQALIAAAGEQTLGQGIGSDNAFFRSSTLTLLKATLPPRFKNPPHEHRMWAVVGIYEGQELNVFYRKTENGLREISRKLLVAPEAIILGPNIIHSIENPLAHPSFGLHVYGGDFVHTERSMWNPLTLSEERYDFQKMLNYSHELMADL